MAETGKQTQDHGFLLGGQWRREGTRQQVLSPYDGSLVGDYWLADRSHAEAAIAAAEQAFRQTRKLPAYERKRVLQQVADGLRAQSEMFASFICGEAGKPLKAARVEVERAILTFETAAEESTRIFGEYWPLDVHESAAGRWGLERRYPVGPILAITPFNFPLNLVAHKVAPAIAAGCSIVLKPAPQTPLTALKLAELITDAGWPAGGLNVLPLSNDDAAVLVESDRLKMLTFTGSAPVGWELRRRAGKKKVVLELGGNSGVIVHSDADVAYAAERCVTGGFGYAGQSCIAVQRILVHRAIFDPFVAALLERVRALKVGDPADPETEVGPLIRESDAERALSWIDEARKAGAAVLTGGERQGALLQPTVMTRTRPEMKVNALEIFAPVVTVECYESFSAAVAEVNRSQFGLQAGVFTRDARLLFQAFDELEVGGVVAGDVPTYRIDPMPYGGIKDSGLGREGIRNSIAEMTEPKLLVMNLR